MNVAFDTNIMIDVANGVPKARAILDAHEDIIISAISWAEFMAGIPLQQWEGAARRLRNNYQVIHTDDDICERAARYRQQYRLKMMDALIYATAIEFGVPLVTRNTKDFDETMPGVHIPYIE